LKFFESNILIKLDLSRVLKPYVFSRLQIKKACVETYQVSTNVEIATFVEPKCSPYYNRGEVFFSFLRELALPRETTGERQKKEIGTDERSEVLVEIVAEKEEDDYESGIKAESRKGRLPPGSMVIDLSKLLDDVTHQLREQKAERTEGR
jgi:hypothetical protein